MDIAGTVDTRKLIPLVRSRYSHEVMVLRAAAASPEDAAAVAEQLAYKVFATHLAVSIAVHWPDGYQMLTRDDFDALGLSFDQALEIAKENLENNREWLSHGISFHATRGFCFPAGEMTDHTSSMILYPEFFRHFPISGDPILLVPHTAMFWATGSEQHDVLRFAFGMTLQEMENCPGRPIATIPFILRGDQWQPWQPPAGHPLYEQVRELYVRHEEAYYGAQTGLLQQQYAALGRNLHVADYRAVTHATPGAATRHLSVAVWRETEPTLLPKTDYVCLERVQNRDALNRGKSAALEFGETIYVPWEAVQRFRCTSPPQEMYPERYLAERFPDQTTWQALLQHAALAPDDLQQSLQGAKANDVSSPADSAAGEKRSVGSLVGILVAVGGGIGVALVVLLFSMLAMATRDLPHQTAQSPALRAGPGSEFKRLRPSLVLNAPAAEEFEAGELHVSQPGSFHAVRELPPFAELPAEPLPTLQSPAGPPHETGLAGGSHGKSVGRDRAPAGGILVGLRIVKGKQWGGAIRSLQPIYQVGDGYVLGRVIGPARGTDQIQHLAKPGYAISAVRVQAGLAVNALQIEFEPLSEELSPDDAPYTTKWFGCVGGASYELTGGPFIGVDACLGDEIVGLQLLSAGEEEGAPSGN